MNWALWVLGAPATLPATSHADELFLQWPWATLPATDLTMSLTITELWSSFIATVRWRGG